ncbi:hypothetical protein [Amphritea sp. HPY]|uniref:hypothetical protein n=1 Tax=Amphritea sp. HPY TaxID=3421652 RepID=UPI003D7E73C8
MWSTVKIRRLHQQRHKVRSSMLAGMDSKALAKFTQLANDAQLRRDFLQQQKSNVCNPGVNGNKEEPVRAPDRQTNTAKISAGSLYWLCWVELRALYCSLRKLLGKPCD